MGMVEPYCQPEGLMEPNLGLQMTEPAVDSVSFVAIAGIGAFPAMAESAFRDGGASITVGVIAQEYETSNALDIPASSTISAHPAIAESNQDMVISSSVELDVYPAVSPKGLVDVQSGVTLGSGVAAYESASLSMQAETSAAMHPVVSESNQDSSVSSNLSLVAFPAIIPAATVDALAAIALSVLDQIYESKSTLDIHSIVSLLTYTAFDDGGIAPCEFGFGLTSPVSPVSMMEPAIPGSMTEPSVPEYFHYCPAVSFGATTGFAASCVQVITGSVSLLTSAGMAETTTAILNSGVSLGSLAKALVDAGVSINQSLALVTIEVFKTARKKRGEMEAFSSGLTLDVRPARVTSPNLQTINQRGGEPFEQEYGMTEPVLAPRLTSPQIPNSMTEPQLNIGPL